MSVAAATASWHTGLYFPTQDRAVSHAGSELRESIRTALVPETAATPSAAPSHQTLELIRSALAEGTVVAVEPFRRMLEVLTTLPDYVPPPDIVIESDREIALDWHEGTQRVLSLTVDDTPYLRFAALFGREPLHGRMPFVGTLPKTLAFLLERLYPQIENDPRQMAVAQPRNHG